MYVCAFVCMCTTMPKHDINESAYFHSMYSENMFFICSFLFEVIETGFRYRIWLILLGVLHELEKSSPLKIATRSN